jgi:hypothetical protein
MTCWSSAFHICHSRSAIDSAFSFLFVWLSHCGCHPNLALALACHRHTALRSSAAAGVRLMTESNCSPYPSAYVPDRYSIDCIAGPSAEHACRVSQTPWGCMHTAPSRTAPTQMQLAYPWSQGRSVSHVCAERQCTHDRLTVLLICRRV